MLKVLYAPSFLRTLASLDKELQEEAFEKMELFKNPANHRLLKTRKLKGRLAGRFGFSVNYRFRVVFMYQSKNEAILLAIGDHEVYRA